MKPAAVVFLVEPIGVLGAIWLALLAIFAIYTIVQIVQQINETIIRPLPVIGKTTSDWIAQHLPEIANAFHRWGEDRVRPVTIMFRHITERLSLALRANTLAHVAALSAIRRVRYDVIPRVQAALIAYVENRVAAVIAYTQAVAAGLQVQMRALTAAQQAYSLALAQQLQLQLAQTRAELLNDDRALLLYGQQLTQAVMVRADQEIERAMRVAQLEDQQVITYAQQLAGLQAQYARQLVLNEQQQRLAQGGELQREISSTATAVITLVLPQIANLAQRVTQIEDSPCQQRCDTLGKVGQNLDGLDLAALLAALLGGATHPKEVAGPITGLLTTGARPVSKLLEGLFK